MKKNEEDPTCKVIHERPEPNTDPPTRHKTSTENDDLVTFYDTTIIATEEHDYIRENWDEEYHRFTQDKNSNPDSFEDEILKSIIEDEELYNNHADIFLDNVQLILDKYGKEHDYYFRVEGNNMTWRNLSGNIKIVLDDSYGLLDKIGPKTSELTAYVYDKSDHIHIVIYHHDSPMGEWYDLYPIKKQEESNE